MSKEAQPKTRPVESDYTSQVAYTRALEAYCDGVAERKPLTDEDIEAVWKRVQANDFHDCVQPFARAIEAAHGIKENT